MQSERTLWSDGRLDNFSAFTKSDIKRIEKDVRGLREELAELREQEWKKKVRRTELFLQVVFLGIFAYVVATIALAVGAPN